jgi:hypothetical protein
MFKDKKKTTITISMYCWYELDKLKLTYRNPSITMNDVIMKLLEEHKCQ